MTNNDPAWHQGGKTLRLTFRVVGGEVQLVRHERLDMICPPSLGERPEAGRHGGFWIELRDPGGRVLSHRLLHAPFRDSVEVHSPDGTMRREVGPPSGRLFEVLLPDPGEASTAVLVGEQPGAAALRKSAPAALESTLPTGSRELARFPIPQ